MVLTVIPLNYTPYVQYKQGPYYGKNLGMRDFSTEISSFGNDVEYHFGGIASGIYIYYIPLSCMYLW